MYPGERLNSLTHLVGAALAATGTAVLVVLATRLGDPWKIVSFSIYGAMLVALYAASTAYHSVRHGHGLWHLFVLGGSVCHFFTVFFYVA